MTKLLVNGKFWKIYVLDTDSFIKRFEGDAAVTILDTRQVYVCEDELTLQVLIHELVHVYYASTCVTSASLTPDQIEEVFCEMFAEYGQLIIKQAKHLHRKLKKELE